MRTKNCLILYTLFFLLAVPSLLSQQQRVIRRITNNPNTIFYVSDWKTFGAYRSVTDVVESYQYIFFATNGSGLLRYDKFSKQFITPITQSNGLLSNHILRIETSIDDTSSVQKNFVLLHGRVKGAVQQQIVDLDISDQFFFPDPVQSGFVAAPNQNRLKKVDKLNESLNFWPPYIMDANGVSDDQFDVYPHVFSYVDSDQGNWLLVRDLGLFFANTDATPFRIIQMGPMKSRINSILLFKKNIWLGQQANKQSTPILSVWQEDNQWQNWKLNQSNNFRIKEINRVRAHKDSLWLATDLGIMAFDPNSQRFRTFRNNQLDSRIINDIIPFGDRLLAGTNDGLYSFNPKANVASEISLLGQRNTEILRLAMDGETVIAVGRFAIYVLEDNLEKISLLNDELDFGVFKTRVVDFYDGKFWFNSDNGIFSYDPKTKENVLIQLTNPKFNLVINKVIVDGDYILLGTNKGLIIFYANLDEWIWITRREGLPANNIIDMIIDGDYLFIATKNAITEFKWFEERRTF